MSDLHPTAHSQKITATELAAKANGSVFIDVRSPIEFETEHIPNSLNIPLNELDLRYEEVPRKGQLFVICRSGKRAERGAHTLMGRGFQPTVLDGGLLAWRKAGLPIKEGKKMLSIERQIQLIVGIGALSGSLLGAFVNPWFLLIPGFFGAGLTFAGLTGTCGLGILLSFAPWNKIGSSTTADKSKDKSNCCS